jgi:hypothetical protein
MLVWQRTRRNDPMDPGWQRELERPVKIRTQTINTLEEARDFMSELSAETRIKTGWRLAHVMLLHAVGPEAKIIDMKTFCAVFNNALKAEGLIHCDRKRLDWTLR